MAEISQIRKTPFKQGIPIFLGVKPGLFNYAVLKLGRLWTPSRTSNPALNQELELEYLQKRSTFFDLGLLGRFIGTLIKSRGNVKARGVADPEAERRVNGNQH